MSLADHVEDQFELVESFLDRRSHEAVRARHPLDELFVTTRELASLLEHMRTLILRPQRIGG